MDETRVRQQITSAVERRCASLTPDPLLARRIIMQVQEKGETKVKRKISLGLVLTLILILLSLSALAVSLLSGMELVEQHAVPLAQGNDLTVRRTESFSPEEIALLVQSAAENGIQLDDNSDVMLALRNGEGYYEEEAIMEICRQAFGGLYYEWTVEQRHWYGEMMIQIGWRSNNPDPLPGEGQMPSQEARTLALTLLSQETKNQYPLDDKEAYRVTEDFDETGWYFTYYPRNLTMPECSVYFSHAGDEVQLNVTPQLWESYTEQELMNGVNHRYGYRTESPYSWDQQAWHIFSQMLPQAEKSEKWSREFDAYLQSVYPLPEEGWLDKKAALDIAQQDAGLKTVLSLSALLMEEKGVPLWKVILSGTDEQDANALLSYEIHAKDGAVTAKRDMTHALYPWHRYVSFAVYDAVTADMLTSDQVEEIARQALWEALEDTTIPFRDSACYETRVSFNSSVGRYTVTFTGKTLEYGSCTVWVSREGKPNVRRAEAPGLSADNAFSRFTALYGSCNDWDQSTWQLLDETLDALPAASMEGKLLKSTAYPAASSVSLSRDEALDIVYQSGTGAPHIIRCMLIGAENPVWKAYLSDDTGCYLVEVDANTGEMTDRMIYKADNPEFDNPVQTYTLRRDYAPLAIQEYGIVRMAEIAITKEEEDMWLDSPVHSVSDSSLYAAKADGDTVTFLPLQATLPTYTVTFTENYTRHTITRTPAGE
ncbi:MAG: hypothetical protein IJB69_07680 [Clostridia bacterium]|nr:hypothetical protein [Clostridia bacterium]